MYHIVKDYNSSHDSLTVIKLFLTATPPQSYGLINSVVKKYPSIATWE